jgi:hypothetical protein
MANQGHQLRRTRRIPVKKTPKKLVLSKETLRKLDENEVVEALGGQSGSICGNPTCKQDCGTTTC